jgi:hypothetical protein
VPGCTLGRAAWCSDRWKCWTEVRRRNDRLPFWYLEGPPDYVELLVDDYRELLVSLLAVVRDHVMGESQHVCGDPVGPPVVLKHSNKKAFGETWQQVPCGSGGSCGGVHTAASLETEKREVWEGHQEGDGEQPLGLGAVGWASVGPALTSIFILG